jgi:hypothetical protein
MKKRHLFHNALLFIAFFSVTGCADMTDEPPSVVGDPALEQANIRFIETVFPDQHAWDSAFAVSSSHPSCNGKEVLSRAKFLQAAARYPKFCGSGTSAINLHELAAFFANVSVETNGASEGEYDGGLCFVKEVACSEYANPECPALCKSYCDKLTPPWNSSPRCPCGYYGRGALQITNPYNYHETSMEVFGDDRLYQDPDMILEGSAAWQTSIAFWMIHYGGLGESVTTIQGPTTCHTAISEHPDFGKTIEVINGNLECKNPGTSYIAKTRSRIDHYRHFVNLFSAVLGLNEAPSDHVQCAETTPPDPDAAKKIRCGTDWVTANATCGTFCTTPDDCEDGEGCFGDLSSEPCDG